MDGRAHERDPHDVALLEEPAQLLGTKAVEPRPERRVRVARLLRLQPNKVLDRGEHRQRRAPEQVLPRERGAVQRPQPEDFRRLSSDDSPKG